MVASSIACERKPLSGRLRLSREILHVIKAAAGYNFSLFEFALAAFRKLSASEFSIYMTRFSFHRTAAFVCLGGSLCAASARATTKGLNQIVTPDIQPQGDLSVSFQLQHKDLGNPQQIQLEYGITKKLEVAVFQGFSPRQTVGGFEYGFLQRGPYLLSGGLANYTTHVSAQPFLEGGYYLPKSKFSLGVTYVGKQTEGIFGYAFQATPKLQLSADYQTGHGNSQTVGFTYSFTDRLSFNPALYLTNDRPRHSLGYAVLTYTFPINEKRPEQTPQEQRTQPTKKAVP